MIQIRAKYSISKQLSTFWCSCLFLAMENEPKINMLVKSATISPKDV